jgi:hypothetical protein
MCLSGSFCYGRKIISLPWHYHQSFLGLLLSCHFIEIWIGSCGLLDIAFNWKYVMHEPPVLYIFFALYYAGPDIPTCLHTNILHKGKIGICLCWLSTWSMQRPGDQISLWIVHVSFDFISREQYFVSETQKHKKITTSVHYLNCWRVGGFLILDAACCWG